MDKKTISSQVSMVLTEESELIADFFPNNNKKLKDQIPKLNIQSLPGFDLKNSEPTKLEPPKHEFQSSETLGVVAKEKKQTPEKIRNSHEQSPHENGLNYLFK